MNDTAASQPGSTLLPSGTGTITTIHLVLIALVALFAIAIIVAGIRRKHIRDRAEREVERHAEQAGVPLVEAEPAQYRIVTPEPASMPRPAAGGQPAPSLPPVGMAPAPAPEPTLADMPIAAVAPIDASPASLATEEPAAPTAATPMPADGPVTQLKGLGPKVAARLAEAGITTVGQLAALTDDQAATLDAQLGTFSGRMTRDRWLEQARFLAAGDRAGFEAVFGRL